MEEKTVALTFANISVFTDGSFERIPYDPPLLPASEEVAAAGATDAAAPAQVRTKDVTLNAQHGTWCRLFLPPAATAAHEKLPILLHFHGGGFVAGSPAWPIMDAFARTLAARTRSLIVSVEYRLAPEHRLPAAYEDGVEALIWLREQATPGVSSADPWLTRYGDFCRVFVVGESAGANLAHHVVVRAVSDLGFATKAGKEGAVRVAGYMILDPFFAGEQLTGTELSKPEKVRISGYLWRLCSPHGDSMSMDHPYANPLARGQTWLTSLSLPPALVSVSDEDVLRDRGIAYFDALKGAGKQAELLLTGDEEHCFFLLCPSSPSVPSFLAQVDRFIHSTPALDHLESGSTSV